jgi:hypothetical protein
MLWLPFEWDENKVLGICLRLRGEFCLTFGVAVHDFKAGLQMRSSERTWELHEA